MFNMKRAGFNVPQLTFTELPCVVPLDKVTDLNPEEDVQYLSGVLFWWSVA